MKPGDLRGWLKRWIITSPNGRVHYVWATTDRNARKALRDRYKVRRLPAGTEVERADQ